MTVSELLRALHGREPDAQVWLIVNAGSSCGGYSDENGALELSGVALRVEDDGNGDVTIYAVEAPL